jgi:hypothetical protein
MPIIGPYHHLAGVSDVNSCKFYSTLRGIFNFELKPERFRHILKVRLEDILFQAQHQTPALVAQGRVIIKPGYPLIKAFTIYTLVFVDRHI